MATQPDPADATPIPEPEDGPESGPLRRCLVRRERFARECMLRFVVGPERQLVFDVSATLPGRGMWLSAAGDVLETALQRNLFARTAKCQVSVPPDLRARVVALLRQRIFDLIGLARRGGAAISGFEKARAWLAAGKAGLVLQAIDGSPEERAR
ncbi:MAG: DUF448 domain-containing protein, partial [Acidocella sp.]|nr:DUF448 domain-containing protein [Acidocella sp.]